MYENTVFNIYHLFIHNNMMYYSSQINMLLIIIILDKVNNKTYLIEPNMKESKIIADEKHAATATAILI